MKRRIVQVFMPLLLAMVCLVGCRHAGVTRLATAPAKPANCQLQLFASESEVGRPFEAVCLVDTGFSATGRRPVQLSEIAELARSQACQCGGDAIIGGGASTGSAEGEALVVKVIRYTGP